MTIEITILPAGQPGPHVQLVLTNINAWRVTVWRTAAGRTFAVRGAVEERMYGGSLGAMLITDWEAPLSQELIYAVEGFNADGDSLGIIDTAATQITAYRSTWGTIHDPYDPAGMVWVQWLAGSFEELVRQVPITEMRAINRSAPYVLSGVRGGLTGLNASCITATREATAKLDRLLGRYDTPAPPAVCIRTGPEIPLPGGMVYASVMDNKRKHPLAVHSDTSFATWELEVDETQPPTPALIKGFPTYHSVESDAFSYADLNSEVETYLDLERRQSLDLGGVIPRP